MTCDVLVVAAFGPELAGLEGLLGASTPPRGLRGRVGSLDVAARALGIGATASAAGAAAALAELSPACVVVVGTCGAYAGSGLAIGDVVVAGRVVLASPCLADGTAEVPPAMVLEAEMDGATSEALVHAGGKRGDLAATLGITVDDAAAARVAASARATAEHLEAFGVASACLARTIPMATALGVANRVGSSARGEWRAHHRAASSAALGVVERWLRARASR